MKKVIIIGAGPAGLTAGYELLNAEDANDYEVVILEETQEIGGISRTVRYNGNRMDIGGHRFFSKSEEVNRLWQELMPVQGQKSIDDLILGVEKELKEGGPDPETENEVFLIRNRISRIFFLRKFFDYPIKIKWATFKNMGYYYSININNNRVTSPIVLKNIEKTLGKNKVFAVKLQEKLF